MSAETIDQIRERAMDHVGAGRPEDACAAFAELAAREPGAADTWINLATVEQSLGRFHAAVEHYRKGIELLDHPDVADKGLLASALHALGSTQEALELTEEAVSAYRQSAQVDPRAPTPLAAMATLLGRAGHLELADKVATEYCLAAVSVLAEKGNIGPVRRFQKALKEAHTVDGQLLLVATREAYVRGFEETAGKLPPGVKLEAEPHRRDEAGTLRPVLAKPGRPWSRVRFDAIEPVSGEKWMIQDAPTYGFPRDCAAAAEGFFSVEYPARTPFRVLISTRTAWDYFFVRLRFANGLGPQTLERAEEAVGRWYLRGMDGEFGQKGRGFFHFLSEPFAIGTHGLRYEVDLGLSELDAIPALLEALTALHQQEPIDIAVLGDGALPLQTP